jgi:hypothetical protein
MGILIGLAALVAMYIFIGALWAMTGMPVELAMVLAVPSMIALFALVGSDEKGKRGQRGSGGSKYATMGEGQRRKEDGEQFDVLLNTSVFDEWDGR